MLCFPKKREANFLRSVRLAGLLPFQPRHVEHDFHGLLRLLKKNTMFQTLALRAAELNYKFYVYVLETRGSKYLRFSIRTSAKKAGNKEEKNEKKQRRGGRAKFFMLEKKIVIIN